MKKIKNSILCFTASFVIFSAAFSCSSSINSNNNEHFSKDGYLINDSSSKDTLSDKLTQVKFYIEVSGSMNGFFRADKPTAFKRDVWDVLNAYSSIAPSIFTLTNDGTQGDSLSLSDFQTKMNTGDFVSTASTKLPMMLESILGKINTSKGDAAVLISDMKYSPVGSAAPEVLVSEYRTTIRQIFNKADLSICLICATSNFLDKQGNEVLNRSPYYYLIIGNNKQVASLRDGISMLLDKQNSFVDNIESGMNYIVPRYKFGIPKLCTQMGKEPTFVKYIESSGADTCSLELKVDLQPYRWLLTDENIFKSAFKAKAIYGSELEIGKTDIIVRNSIGRNIIREAEAVVNLKLCHMPTDSEVIEWTLDIPHKDLSKFEEFFGAQSETDLTKSYSIEDFIEGLFYDDSSDTKLKSNYILVSKN